MKYFISFIAILGSFFLQYSWTFWWEEKVTRLIDLSPKEEAETTTGSQLGLSGAVKWTWSVQKSVEKKVKTEKVVVAKDEKEVVKNEQTEEDEWVKDEKENVQSLINSYILETYKAQWDKILKDMDMSLQKKIPDTQKRIQAYDSIQTTLELRKTRILKVNISEVNKELLWAYFDYMITSLEKRKENLEETLQN